MNFHGLFVGIDSYESPAFRGLRFAKRDATVLNALFIDNLGGKTTVLLDADATKKKMVTEMGHLAERSTDEDFVTIAFSGHGTVSGELATYDALPDRLAETALPLDRLAELVSRIRARVLLIALDCCFSGQAADKVLLSPGDGATSRDGALSVTRGLEELRGVGRIILAAASKDQEAFEVPEFRHGLLSHYLIQGLLGDREARDGDEVPVLKLAHFVAKNISSHKNGITKKTQTPVLSAVVDNLNLRVFAPGPLYRATADALKPPPANPRLVSLQAYGIPESVVKMWQSRYKTLNPLQVDAINEGGLLEGLNVLVSAPTSAGKTMVGELAAMRAVAERRRAVFLLPTRALVNEQYERFQRLYAPLGIRTVRATGELRDQLADVISNQFELAVLTYEKFIGLASGHPGLLDAGVLVIDEIQSLMLPGRGPLLETLLTWLKARDSALRKPQIVGLSAVLGEPDNLARWLTANLVETTRRDIPLFEGVIGPDGLCRYLDQQGKESTEQLLDTDASAGIAADDRLVIRLVRKLVAEGQQVIVFRSTRGQARSLAEQLARTLGLSAADSVLAELPRGDEGWTSDLLRKCIAKGVAFHIADLTTDERRLLEGAFRAEQSEIRVLVATTTLAQGVNLPADAVVVCELEHPAPNGQQYSVSEYKNMAGRAGRVGLAERGRAFVLTRGTADADQKWRQYVQARPEAVRSALLEPSADTRAVLLAAFTEPAVRAGTGVERFMASTFAAYLSRAEGSDDPFPGPAVQRQMNDLVNGGFLLDSPSGLALTGLGEVAVRSGLSVDSVTTVVEALKNVSADRINRATLICAAQLVPELDDVRFNRVGATAYKEHVYFSKKLKEFGADDGVVARLMGTPTKGGTGIGHGRRSIACLMWSGGIPLSVIERVINRSQRATNPAAPGPVQHAAQRAADVIGVVVEIACLLHQDVDLGTLPDVLPAQLELGIVAGLVPVARRMRTPLPRPVYLRLAGAGLKSPADVLAADPARLLEYVGGHPEQLLQLSEAASAACDEDDWDDFDDLFSPLAE